MKKEIAGPAALEAFGRTLPEETTSDRLPEDLEIGNFDDATFVLPSGSTVEITYTDHE